MATPECPPGYVALPLGKKCVGVIPEWTYGASPRLGKTRRQARAEKPQSFFLAGRAHVGRLNTEARPRVHGGGGGKHR